MNGYDMTLSSCVSCGVTIIRAASDPTGRFHLRSWPNPKSGNCHCFAGSNSHSGQSFWSVGFHTSNQPVFGA